MPITSSAKKALRVAQNKKTINDRLRRKLKSLLKKPPKNLSDVISMIDKASKRGIIHKNKANRLKAKLMQNIKTNLAKKSTAQKSEKKVAKKITKPVAKKIVTKKKIIKKSAKNK
ncbi:MAG: 30S ribosomal protein S20 [Berkelbacteria bacterium GW2011_GWA2_35_9]|uniref:Small ribosomal subunit protein bS20 n=1 Tax=Berkelbacteria bacterium GW2011_GWA2_35_9 TaxID=1618333 RepID=A0A0G0FK37_9BACT|nr:MAG: 30S ribosomal protein S20 [Berkelbacteria bacterium GW2011_GWA2_35_9]